MIHQHIRLAGRTVIAVVAAVLVSTPAMAQSVEGTVTHEVTGRPLAGVLVSVLQADGTRVRGVLTDAAGRFLAEVPLGRYRIHAERIGLRPATGELFDVSTFNATPVTLTMTERPVEIEGLVVDSRVRSCRTNEREAGQIQRWWSEIRNALDVSSALQSEQFGRFIVERFERQWDDDMRDVLASSERFEVSSSTRPFVSAPASELVDEGFARGSYGPNREYYGPDADVLLSSDFLTEHCFSLDDDRDRPHQLGLRFEPVDGRTVSDIEGTLWIDTLSAELQDLDFSYVNLDGPDEGEAGGRVEFDYLPTGAWIVSDWAIHMPETGVRGKSLRLTTLGYLEGGGSVVPLTPPAPGGATGTVQGMVRDSLRGGGLAGATVTLLGTSRQTVTDDDGRFWLFEVPAGEHYITFSTRELDAWGLNAGYRPVDVRPDASTTADLALPAFPQVATSLCLSDGLEAESIVAGRLLGPDREPISGQTVQLTYDVIGEHSGQAIGINLVSDETGKFRVCRVPGEVTVTMRIRVDGEWADVVEFASTSGAVTYQEVWFQR